LPVLSCNLGHEFFQNEEAGYATDASAVEREDPQWGVCHVSLNAST